LPFFLAGLVLFRVFLVTRRHFLELDPSLQRNPTLG
jgi:hypothetical protein